MSPLTYIALFVAMVTLVNALPFRPSFPERNELSEGIIRRILAGSSRYSWELTLRGENLNEQGPHGPHYPTTATTWATTSPSTATTSITPYDWTTTAGTTRYPTTGYPTTAYPIVSTTLGTPGTPGTGATTAWGTTAATTSTTEATIGRR